jgi:GNAT superfamily N-acetyltransferase
VTVELAPVPWPALAELAGVPTAFRVDRVLQATRHDDGRVRFTERPIPEPYIKDYDALDGGPLAWPGQLDLSRGGLILARDRGRCVGGAVILRDVPDFDLFEGREDPALLHDLRVDPAHRRGGIGRALLAAAADWAGSRGCRTLVIETQDVNAAACRLYAGSGAALTRIDPRAYPALPGETRLVWELQLPSA